MRLLGIDPGLLRTGYACVELGEGSFEPRLVEAGVLRLPGETSVVRRLALLHDELAGVIDELRPDRMAVESVFSNRRFVRTAIIMAHARGVVLLCGALRNLAIDELPPATVKKALTGRGDASKVQMQQAVMEQCGLAELPEPPDVADAIAIALCGARRLTLTM